MSSSEEHTQQDLLVLISSLEEGLTLYESTLEPAKLLEIETKNDNSKGIDAEEELLKLSKLIFAHTTKIGIAFRPPISANAAYSQLKECGELFLILVGVVAHIFNHKLDGDEMDKFGDLYRAEILEHVKGLISLFKDLLSELQSLDYNLKKGDMDESGRLVGVGKVWDCCEKLQKLIKDGKLGLLKNKIKLSVAVTEDLIEEYEEWLENPQIVDDPFGFGDDSEDEDEESKEIDQEVIEFAQKWLSKVKMVRLLFSSLIRSLPSDNTKVTGAEIDLFNKEQNNFFNLVDDLVASMFLNTSIFALKADSKKVQGQSDLLIKLLKRLNKGNEKKTQWLSLWQEKFLQ